MPIQLKKFERNFTEFIFNNADPKNISAIFKTYSQEELSARLSIYKNNVFASLIANLADLYPAVMKTVGTDFFNSCAKTYLIEHPPTHASLLEFGTGFPQFIQTFKPALSLPYLADVARIDLACHHAYHAQDAIPLQPGYYANYDLELLAAARIIAHPSASLITSPFACFSIWNLPAQANDIKTSIPANTPESVLILRPFMEVNSYLLEPGMYHFLHTLFERHTIAHSLSEAADIDENFNPTEAIQFLVSSGLAVKLISEAQ